MSMILFRTDLHWLLRHRLAELTTIAAAIACFSIQQSPRSLAAEKTPDNDQAKLTIGADSLVEEIAGISDKSRVKSLIVKPGTGDRPKLNCLRDLTNLESLDLSGNKFDGAELAPLAQLQSLKHLGLDRNDIATRFVSEVICKLPKLEILSLRQTRITNDALPYLAKIKTLSKLSLSSTNMKSPSTALNDVPFTVLAELPHLTELELRGLSLRNNAILSLAEIRTLRKLDLGTIVVPGTPDVYIEFKRRLPTMPVADIYLRCCRVDIEERDDQERLVRIGRCSPGQLKAIVEMNETTVLRAVAIRQTEAFLQLPKIPSLRDVHVTSSVITDMEIDCLNKLPELESLALEDCELECSLERWRELMARDTLKRVDPMRSRVPEAFRKEIGDKLTDL